MPVNVDKSDGFGLFFGVGMGKLALDFIQSPLLWDSVAFNWTPDEIYG
ncbi:MAG: hypothetical protein MK081_03905 [Flavobacteriales bacterium]|nr:hypothetical protein [Flavobacteriales bacterium]